VGGVKREREGDMCMLTAGMKQSTEQPAFQKEISSENVVARTRRGNFKAKLREAYIVDTSTHNRWTYIPGVAAAL
jgi:hypothetical protein